jgi:hypothetical protein
MEARISRLLLLLLAGAMLASAQTPCTSTPVYEPCEIEFELAESEAARHANPYLTVELRVEFRAPRGDTYRMPGFWDGGRKLKVRFSPLAEGRWDFRITSNIERFTGKTGSFNATPASGPGFVVPFNVHHFKYVDVDRAHYWMGDTCYRFATLPMDSFRRLIDLRAEQKFNHVRGLVLGDEQNAGRVFPTPDQIVPEHFQAVDERVRYMNQKGIVFDLVLAGANNHLVRLFPNWRQRERYVRYLVARYAAMNITWQGVQEYETYENGGALLKDLGDLLKQIDPYGHPRSTHTVQTSAPLAGAGWMNYTVHRAYEPNLFAVEYQLYPQPFVNAGLGQEDSGAGKTGADDLEADALRRRIWNAAINGQYVTYANTGTSGAGEIPPDLQYAESPGARQMTHLYDFFTQTRYFDLQPYFRVEGGRALALEQVEYIVYLEKPGPVDLIVHRTGYQVSWFNPADGTWVKEKDFKGERFTTKGPPDNSHDWVLYVRRDGRKESMNRSYKLESKRPVVQTAEVNRNEVPFEIQLPSDAELTAGAALEFNATLKKDTRLTRQMIWLWTGEAPASGLGYRVLGASQFGQFTIPADISRQYPTTFFVRLLGLDGNGKLFASDRVYTLKK